MKTLTQIVLAAVTGIFLSGCGQSDQLPVGASLRAFPQQVSWQIAPSTSCNIDEGRFNDSLITVSLLDDESNGLLDVPVDLSLDLSETTGNGASVLTLFFDNNSDGIYTDDEIVSVAGGPVFSAKTDSDNGVIQLLVRVNLSCPYRGQLFAFAGSAATSVQFEVSAENDSTAAK